MTLEEINRVKSKSQCKKQDLCTPYGALFLATAMPGHRFTHARMKAWEFESCL